MAEHLGVHPVIGMLGIHLHTLSQEVVAIGVEIQALGLSAVETVVVGTVITDAQVGAKRSQHLVLLGGHMILCREFGVVLIVVGPARKD